MVRLFFFLIFALFPSFFVTFKVGLCSWGRGALSQASCIRTLGPGGWTVVPGLGASSMACYTRATGSSLWPVQGLWASCYLSGAEVIAGLIGHCWHRAALPFHQSETDLPANLLSYLRLENCFTFSFCWFCYSIIFETLFYNCLEINLGELRGVPALFCYIGFSTFPNYL